MQTVLIAALNSEKSTGFSQMRWRRHHSYFGCLLAVQNWQERRRDEVGPLVQGPELPRVTSHYKSSLD
jgi:hypothetical protein